MADQKPTKEFLPSVTQEDLTEWQDQIAFVRHIYTKGKWPNGKETLEMMDEIYKSMKKQFAVGEGIWVLLHNENNNDGQGIQGKIISIG